MCLDNEAGQVTGQLSMLIHIYSVYRQQGKQPYSAVIYSVYRQHGKHAHSPVIYLGK